MTHACKLPRYPNDNNACQGFLPLSSFTSHRRGTFAASRTIFRFSQRRWIQSIKPISGTLSTYDVWRPKQIRMLVDSVRSACILLLWLCATSLLPSLLAQVKSSATTTPDAICPGCVTITNVSGGGQEGGVSTVLPNRLVAKATLTFNGAPVVGENIDFQLTAFPQNSSGASLSGDPGQATGIETVSKTAADGTASAQLTLGNLPGQYQVTATCLACVSAMFTETATGSNLAISTTSLPSIGTGRAYNATLTATGGTGTGYTWCVLDGSTCDPNPASPAALPAGFTLDSSSGHILADDENSAIPGKYTFMAQVTDSGATNATRALNLEILCQVNPIEPKGIGRSIEGNHTAVLASFSPPNGQTLSDYAMACGFSNFDWVQYITGLPTPAADGSGAVTAASNPNQPLSPPFIDPPTGGYTYEYIEPYHSSLLSGEPNFAVSNPFYYSTLDLGSGCLYGSPCFLNIESDPSTLEFYDAPMNSLCNYPSDCIALQTQLVGVCDSTSISPSCVPASSLNPQGQWASQPLYQWNWKSAVKCHQFDIHGSCTLETGGTTVSNTYLPPDGSVSGGVSITSINGVPSPAISVDASADSINFGTPLSVAVTVAQFDGQPVPAGTVTVSSGAYTSAATTLDGNGAATLTIPVGSLPVGSDLLTAAYAPSAAVSASYSRAWGTAVVTVNAITPQITFAPIPSTQTYGTPITAGSLDAIAQSNGSPVSGTFAYTTGACGGGPILTAGTSVLDAGSYSITACFTPSQAGFAASSATAPYSVTPASQSIKFGPIPAQSVGATLSLNAAATSGLPVSLQSLTPSVCSVSGKTATMLSLGTCTIQSTQSGGSDYYAATPVQISFPVMGFTLTAEPKSETVKRGVIGLFLLEVKSVNGFAGNVSISCTGGPPHSVCRDFPQTIRLGANRKAFALSSILFRPQDAAETYSITFTGISGTDIRATTAQFTVK
jgi:Bacterial Ig-like domain (group 3)